MSKHPVRRWQLAAALLLLACGSPVSGAPNKPPGPARTEKPAAVGQVQEAQRLIAAVAALPRLSRPAVEKLFRVSLRPAPDANGDPTLWQASLPGGPFSVVRLREPGPAHKFGPSLTLQARNDEALTKQAFEARYLGPIVDMNPNIPPEGTVAHAFLPAGRQGSRPGSAQGPTTVVEFWSQSHRLRQVTVKHPPAATAR